MAVLIDTDLLIDLDKGNAAIENLPGEEERAINVITVSELLHGVLHAHGARRARRQAFVEHLLAGLQAIPVSELVARVHADIWSQLARPRRAGRGPRPLDRRHSDRTRTGHRDPQRHPS